MCKSQLKVNKYEQAAENSAERENKKTENRIRHG